MKRRCDYRFVSRWQVKARVEEVCDILSDPSALPRWWPEVYLSVREAPPGVFELHTKGWLPYTLRWRFRAEEGPNPDQFRLRAWGDLEGTGTWTLRQCGDLTELTYQWNVRVRKRLLRWFSFALRRVFEANHRWAMARGEAALQAELARRAESTGRAA